VLVGVDAGGATGGATAVGLEADPGAGAVGNVADTPAVEEESPPPPQATSIAAAKKLSTAKRWRITLFLQSRLKIWELLPSVPSLGSRSH